METPPETPRLIFVRRRSRRNPSRRDQLVTYQSKITVGDEGNTLLGVAVLGGVLVISAILAYSAIKPILTPSPAT